MKVTKYILFSFLLLSLNGFSQDTPSPFRIWRLTSLSGEGRVRGTYREYESNRDITNHVQKNSYVTGFLQLRTKSFFVHPNFMLVNFNATYNPEARREDIIGLPGYTENTNREGLDFSAIFFSKKQINLTTHAILENSIQNIDNISRVQTKTKQYGAMLSYTNVILPVKVGYTEQKTEQKTIGSDNRFNFDQRLIQATATKSFTDFDSHSLDYMHAENTSTYTNPLVQVQPSPVINTIDQLELINNIAFDKEKKYTFNSTITNSNERGSFNYKRFFAREILDLKLRKNLLFSNNYNLGITQLDSNKITYQGIQSSLNHQLYESLFSKLFFEHNQTSQTSFEEQRNKIGFDLRYVKKIPTGKLTLFYTFYREYQKVKTAPTLLNTQHEQYTLTDNQITLLKNQNVNISTVVVRDVTGTILYQVNIDYLLLDENPYVEIVRIPGGMIPNNGTVYIDYTSMQAGLYNYFMDNRSFGADVLLFKDVLNIYYRINTQDYYNQTQTDNLVLNYYTRIVTGVRLDFNYIKFGVEYEYYKSTVLPYHGLKYFVHFNKMYKKLFFTLNANMLVFQMSNEEFKREDIDISGKVAYSILNNVKLDFDCMYRSMKGRGIDVDLTTAKIELTSVIHRLYVSFGAEFYMNQDRNNTVQFRGVFIQVTRNF